MGVLSWALSRRANATADPTIPAQDGASARSYMDMLRGIMTAARALADDQGGAIVTGGLLPNVYTAFTASGVTTPRAGLSFLLKIDRVNTGAATLNVDGTGPKPWRDVDGKEFDGGMLPAGRFLRATFDEDRAIWVSDVLVLDERYQNPLAYTFPTRAAAQAATIPFTATSLVLRGLNTVGDGLGGTYKRVSQATSDASFVSADNGIWQRTELAILRDLYVDDCAGFTDHDKLVAGNAAALASGRRLCITRQVKVSADIVFSCDLVFAPGGRLIKDPAQVSTLTVSMSGGLSAGPRQIFDRALTIYLAQARCDAALYEWWGAIGDKNPGNGPGLPDATAAINACWASGHNMCRGVMRCYRHTGTLFARNEKTTYGPPLGSLLTEMWFDDPTGTKDAVIVQSASGGSVYGAVLGEHNYIRMQRATAGCAVWMVYAIDIEVGGTVYASAGPSDPRWYRGIGIGPKCQDVHLDRMRGIGACVSAGVYGNITNPDDLVNGVYLPDAYIRDCPNNVSLYGYIIGIFSFPKTLNYNGLSTCYALGSPVRSGMNVVKIQGGDIDTGGTGLYASNVGSLSVTCWVATFAKCMTLKDCDNLVIDLTQLYPAGASAEGIEVQGCIGGSISIGAASGGLYVIRVRASDVTGLGNRLSAHLPSCSYQQYGIIDNSNPPGTGARFVVWQVGYLSANVATAPDPTGTFLDIVAARAM